MLTISGTLIAHSRTNANRASSQSGSAMMLIATLSPMDRATSSALLFTWGRGALAERRQALLIEGLQAEEHVVQAQPPPAAEHLLVAEQDVAAGLQVVLLADAAPLELPGDLVAVLGLDEGHVVDDEHAGLGDAGHVLDGGLRRQPPVAAAVEGPRGAERAVPRAAAGELDRGGRVHHPDEVLAPPPAQMPGRKMIVEAVHHLRRPAGSRPR